jgi:hypothetical protein
MYPSQLQELLEDTERREKEVLLKRRALEMLPSARDNIGTWLSGCLLLRVFDGTCLFVYFVPLLSSHFLLVSMCGAKGTCFSRSV